MTIAVGFRCTDGLVLAADRQVTCEDLLKLYRRKIGVVDVPHEKVLVIVGAGDTDYFGYLYTEIADNFQGKSLHDIRGLLQEITEDTYKKHIHPYHEQPESVLAAIVGVSVKGEGTALFRIHKSIVIDAEPITAIGSGSILATYLADRFFYKTLSVEEAKFLAATIGQKVGAYDPYCGSDADVCIIGNNGEHKFVDSSEIGEMQSKLFLVDDELQAFLGSCWTWLGSEKEFDKRFQELRKKLRKYVSR